MTERQHYAFERLRDAAEAIRADPDRDLKERLYEAVVHSLASVRVQDFEDDRDRADFEWILNALTRYPAESESEPVVEATLRQTSGAEDEMIAARIAALAARLN